MNNEKELYIRSGSKCELCGVKENLGVYEIPPDSTAEIEQCLLLCGVCRVQIDNPDKIDEFHWHCLNDSMWSQVPAVQVMAWRMLTRLRANSWAQDLLDSLYLDDETLQWAQAYGENENISDIIKHVDSNGAVLESGDTVTLIKDLNVKGASFTAKRGTAVRRISLVADNPDHIEGRIDGQQIVILTKFVKKSN